MCVYTHELHTHLLALLNRFHWPQIFRQAMTDRGLPSHYFPGFYGDFVGPYRTREAQNWKSSNPKEVAVQLVYLSHQIHTSLVNLMFTADSVSFVENRQGSRRYNCL